MIAGMSPSATPDDAAHSAAGTAATNAAKARAAQAPPPPPEPLAFPVADSHTHLDMQEPAVADALTAAAAVGVTTVVQVGCDLERSRCWPPPRRPPRGRTCGPPSRSTRTRRPG